MATLDDVRRILSDSLQVPNADKLRPESGLLGVIPELDSMAVVTIITALEENYGFAVDDDEIDAEVFETVGSLVKFIDRKLAN